LNKKVSIELLGIKFSNVSYKEILDAIQFAIQTKKQLTICYANANSINLSFKEIIIRRLLSEFDIVHPDGFGVYLASKLLYGSNGFSLKQSGSDFYKFLIELSIKKKLSLFLFGDMDKTLYKIKLNYPELLIVGLQNGFNFNNKNLLIEINKTNPDILIVGTGTPLQENWIVENKNLINTKIIIAVGDGIKIFAGTKKRGPKFIQKIGLEWFVRFLYEPKRLWKRYFIGIPLFIFRIIKFKFTNAKTK